MGFNVRHGALGERDSPGRFNRAFAVFVLSHLNGVQAAQDQATLLGCFVSGSG
jgi:hypothetical protein